MDKIFELGTIATSFVISFVGWVFLKAYSYFDVKIKRIDSIEELKKDFEDFKVEQREDIFELKKKIDKIYDKLIK